MSMKVKIPYQKPGIELVDFSLSASIAAACKWEMTATDDVCIGVDADGWTIYNTSLGCDYPVDDKDVCYHVPVADNNVFAS